MSLTIAPGAGGWLLVGISATLLFLAYHLVDSFNRLNQVDFARTDPRWRFFSAMGWLTLTMMCQSLAFALSARRAPGFFADGLGQPWSWLLLAFGFAVFPVIWLELIFTRNWNDLGFTRLYEENCVRAFPERMKSYYQRHGFPRGLAGAPAGALGRIRRLGSFLRTWFWMYLWLSLTGFHFRVNRRRDFRTSSERAIQLAHDLLVWVTTAVFAMIVLAFGFTATVKVSGLLLKGIGSASIHIPHPHLGLLAAVRSAATWAGDHAFPSMLVGVIELWLAALVIAVAAYAGLTPEREREPFPLVLFLVWGLAALSDGLLGGTVTEETATRWATAYRDVGGVTLVVLIIMIGYLIVRLAREITQALQRSQGELLRHRVGNLLFPARTALILSQKELGDLLSAGAAGSRLEILLPQIEAGINGISGVQDLVKDVENLALRDEPERWLALSVLLEPLPGRVPPGLPVSLHVGNPETAGRIEVLAPQRRLENALANLVDNAVHALRDGPGEGTIVIRIVPDAGTDAGELELVVEDSGPGVPPEMVDRIFEPGVTTKPYGTGLGLVQVRQTMEDLGGRIELGSAQPPLGGAAFHLHFPARRWRVV